MNFGWCKSLLHGVMDLSDLQKFSQPADYDENEARETGGREGKKGRGNFRKIYIKVASGGN